VPNERRGLGLGLAALVHGFTRLRGEPVALAQIFGKRADEPDAAPGPVEAFIPPNAWRDLAGQGNAPGDVKIVLTGAFEPPDDGGGVLRLLAYDARDGGTRAQAEVHIDGERAGEAIASALEKVWGPVGELSELLALKELRWDALESVLQAERCALHDPVRGGPHDRLAAMLHLGRAIEDAPAARYPAGRLAVLALDAAHAPAPDRKLAEAALRAVSRAAADAPDQPDLLEAAAALHLRLGQSLEAEATALAGLAREPTRARLYVLVSEARRARGDAEGARRAVEEGLVRATPDAALGVEHGLVLASVGDPFGAERAWQEVLARVPLYPAAFVHLAGLVASRQDPVAAEALVDQALASKDAHPEVLRCALRLAHGAEAAGVARAARIASLSRALLAKVPEDAGAMLALGQSQLQSGEGREASASFARVEAMAPRSPAAAEAQRSRFAAAEPVALLEVEATLRAARDPKTTAGALDALSARARRLVAEHPVWPAWLALARVERRRGALAAGREALNTALQASPAADGAPDVHCELAHALAALGDGAASLRHAERAMALTGGGGESVPALAALGGALAACGRAAEADAVLARAQALAPQDEELRALVDAVRQPRRRFQEAEEGAPANRSASWKRWAGALFGRRRR
jgi:tetratricopeptide (TPR) repeat protein